MATIRKRGDSYQIRVSVGYDTKGNHKEQAMTWKPEQGMTQRQIEKELNRQAVMFEESVNHGFKTSAMKFQELAEEWFENYAKNALRSTTYERMLQLTHRVYPAIGHLRIDKITARHLQGFVNSLAKEGANEKTGKPLAPKTIRHNLSFISDVFSYAVRMDLVSDNPCRKVTIPKGEVKEKPIYSQEEIAHLLTAINGEDTKTKRSKRVLKISSYIMGILKELKDEQDEEALRLGDKWVESDRLFVKGNGEPMNNQTPYGWLKEFCEKNDMPFYGIHSFRHFAASALISSGLDVVTVSGALGHCNLGTTLNVYAHMFQTAQARVAQAMDGAFSFLPQDSTR